MNITLWGIYDMYQPQKSHFFVLDYSNVYVWHSTTIHCLDLRQWHNYLQKDNENRTEYSRGDSF